MNTQAETAKKIGRAMAVRMGLTMSFCLALTGTLTSGHFTLPGFLISFILSSIISLLIGFILPIGKLSGDFCKALKLERGSLAARCAESFISDLIYTPVITLIMVAAAYFMVMRQSNGQAHLSFLPMFLSSLVICFIVGYILIFIISPIYMNSIMKKYGGGVRPG